MDAGALCLYLNALTLCALAAGWAWAGHTRRSLLARERRRRDEAPVRRLPPVTVLLPVRGVRAHSADNWRAQLALAGAYPGRVRFLFLVESAGDPAAAAARAALAASGGAKGRVLVAGLSERCSQKCHNLAVGVAAACGGPAGGAGRPAYLLALDDDVAPHRRALADMVAALEADRRLFAATGYPLDLPPRGAGLAAHATAAYHLPLLAGISAREVGRFVWGGCMLLRAAELAPADAAGVLRAWTAGGYSDDLALAARCSDLGLPVLALRCCTFPQRLDGAAGWASYWRYMRRQLAVLATHDGPACAARHALMGAGLAAAGAAMGGAALATAWLIARGAADAVASAAACAAPGDSGSGGGRGPAACAGAALLAAWERIGTRPFLAHAAALALAHAGLASFLHAALRLCAALAGPQPPPPDLDARRVAWGRTWLGIFLTYGFVVPAAAAAAFLGSGRITWGGATYTIRGGRVVHIARRPP